MKKIISIVATAATTFMSLSAERSYACVETDDSSCFKRADGEVIPIEPAFEDYLYMYFDICDVMHMECSYPVLMGDLGYNAVATRHPVGGEIIIYDRKLSSISDPEVVIAHEMAHLKCQHLDWPRDEEHAHMAELQADRFAGAAMRLLGRPRDGLPSAYDFLKDQPSLSHPAKELRIEALLSGFDDPEAARECR
jgi:hypothetical protein